VFVPPPDKAALLEILKVHTKNMPLADDVDVEKIADMAEGFSGADIEGLTREAAMAAVRDDWKARPVMMKHFEAAMQEVRPSISSDDMKRYHLIAEQVFRRQPHRDENAPGYI
jgi:transitional endoplasmic reticulum ATPase